MMLAVPSILLTLAAVIQAATVDPPPASRGLPADLVGTDVDLIAHADLNNTVCPELKALRQSCYEQAKAKQSFEYESQCLCSPDVAYAVARCASGQYGGLDDKQERAAYYQDFLYYTYDCWCVANKVDVTYNATASPVVPFVKGWTGDAILPPPKGSCPEKKRDAEGKDPDTGVVKTPVPPCNCKPPTPNPPVLPCSDGYTRCSGKCIPVPTPCAKCYWPYTQQKGDCTKCVCAPPYVERNGKCEKPPETCKVCCKPHELLVRGCFQDYCSCEAGYERCGDNCVAACPKGETRGSDCTCKKNCTGGKVPGWNGSCVCPPGLKEDTSGTCVKTVTCKPNENYDEYFNSCYCPLPDYAYDRDGNCEKKTCSYWSTTCYPQLAEVNYANETTAVISSSPPAETAYVQTVLSEGATPLVTELAESTTLAPEATVTVTDSLTSDAEPTPTLDESTTESAGPTDSSSESAAAPTDSSASSSPDPYGPAPTAAPSEGGSGSDTGAGGDPQPSSGSGGSDTSSGGGDSNSDSGTGDTGGSSDADTGSADASADSGPSESPTARSRRRRHARHF